MPATLVLFSFFVSSVRWPTSFFFSPCVHCVMIWVPFFFYLRTPPVFSLFLSVISLRGGDTFPVKQQFFLPSFSPAARSESACNFCSTFFPSTCSKWTLSLFTERAGCLFFPPLPPFRRVFSPRLLCVFRRLICWREM